MCCDGPRSKETDDYHGCLSAASSRHPSEFLLALEDDMEPVEGGLEMLKAFITSKVRPRMPNKDCLLLTATQLALVPPARATRLCH